MRGPLRRRDVRLIVAAVGASAAGDFILWVPLTLHLQAMTDSGIAVAALFIALWAPVVVLAPVAGLLVDRLEARGLLLVVSLLQAAVAGAMAFALDSEAAILALAALLGTGFAVAQPAEFSLVPVIGGDEALTEVNGLVETARYVGMTAGPALGGLIAARRRNRAGDGRQRGDLLRRRARARCASRPVASRSRRATRPTARVTASSTCSATAPSRSC